MADMNPSDNSMPAQENIPSLQVQGSSPSMPQPPVQPMKSDKGGILLAVGATIVVIAVLAGAYFYSVQSSQAPTTGAAGGVTTISALTVSVTATTHSVTPLAGPTKYELNLSSISGSQNYKIANVSAINESNTTFESGTKSVYNTHIVNKTLITPVNTPLSITSMVYVETNATDAQKLYTLDRSFIAAGSSNVIKSQSNFTTPSLGSYSSGIAATLENGTLYTVILFAENTTFAAVVTTELPGSTSTSATLNITQSLYKQVG